MSRMIDADARVTVQSIDIEHEEYEHTEMSVAEALDFATDEGCPPTIDAIPVEWLEKKQREGFHRMCAKAVLDMWKNEQGVNDG